jgi:CBS-domain-containing membrane protein
MRLPPDRPSLLARIRVPRLLERYPLRVVQGAFVFINGFVTIGLLGLVASISKTPFIFPSLGPTALLLFHDPESDAASPRNSLCGHLIGILCGYGALWLLSLTLVPRAIGTELHAERVVCAALSLVSTGVFMVAFDVWHPPAGATTLIVSLGLISRPYHLLIIELAVAALVVQALIINRLAGLRYPLWAAPRAGGLGAPLA